MHFVSDSSKNTKAGIALVGSTLPAALIAKQISLGHIAEIYTSDQRFLESYQYVIDQSGMNVGLRSISHNNILRSVGAIIRLLKSAKSREIPIFIYHECCWPILDLGIWLVRPIGVFQPQADLALMFKPVTNANFFFRKLPFLQAIKKTLFSFLFNYYYATNDGRVGLLIVPAIFRYPKSIVRVNMTELSPAIRSTITEKSFKMLLLSGTDAARSEELREVYRAIVNKAISFGYEVLIKDHPNPECRLNLEIDGVKIINPAIPTELLEDRFSIIVGTASAAMATFGKRSISIIGILKSMQYNDKQQRLKYIQTLNPLVRFVEDIDSVFK